MGTRIAVFTDAHANLPALRAALAAIRAAGVDTLYHIGDAVAIGPQPLECLELLLAQEDAALLTGNHDQFHTQALPVSCPAGMSEVEWRHQQWMHAQLGTGHQEAVAQWPLQVRTEIEGVGVLLAHYGLQKDGRTWQDIVRQPQPEDLDQVFALAEEVSRPISSHMTARDCQVDLVFFGHDHAGSDLLGRRHYVNPGSLGCQRTATAPYCLVEFAGDGSYAVRHRLVSYDDGELHAAFEDRQVPERGFIYRTFFGGRFPPP
jgi:predicted phosphodiesterase